MDKEGVLTEEEYKKMLDQHDWLYFMSDDPRVYENGRFVHNKLLKLAGTNSNFSDLFFHVKDKKYKNLK